MNLYADAVAINWAVGTRVAIENAPAVAIEAAIEDALADPKSLIRMRHETERSDPRAWQAFKRGFVRPLVENALASGEGNTCARIHAALSRQSMASALRSIFRLSERRTLSEFQRIMRSGLRVKPLGPDGIEKTRVKAIKSRGRGLLAQLHRTCSSARLLAASDEWFAAEAAMRSVAVLESD